MIGSNSYIKPRSKGIEPVAYPRNYIKGLNVTLSPYTYILLFSFPSLLFLSSIYTFRSFLHSIHFPYKSLYTSLFIRYTDSINTIHTHTHTLSIPFPGFLSRCSVRTMQGSGDSPHGVQVYQRITWRNFKLPPTDR